MGKILYFVNGTPSQAEAENARLAGALIRNAQAWHAVDYIEQCDEVMGDPAVVPSPYLKWFKPPAPKAKRKKNAADN